MLNFKNACLYVLKSVFLLVIGLSFFGYFFSVFYICGTCLQAGIVTYIVVFPPALQN